MSVPPSSLSSPSFPPSLPPFPPLPTGTVHGLPSPDQHVHPALALDQCFWAAVAMAHDRASPGGIWSHQGVFTTGEKCTVE